MKVTSPWNFLKDSGQAETGTLPFYTENQALPEGFVPLLPLSGEQKEW